MLQTKFQRDFIGNNLFIFYNASSQNRKRDTKSYLNSVHRLIYSKKYQEINPKDPHQSQNLNLRHRDSFSIRISILRQIHFHFNLKCLFLVRFRIFLHIRHCLFLSISMALQPFSHTKRRGTDQHQ